MVHRHRRIQPRQKQTRRQRQIPQDAHAGRGNIIDRAVLGRLHQPPEADRREKALRQSIDQQADLPAQKPLTELVRPLGVLEHRKRGRAGAGHALLHRRRGQKPRKLDLIEPSAHPLDARHIAQAVHVAERHAGAGLCSDDLLLQPQTRRAQVAADKARVRAHRLGEGILRALDRALGLRRRRRALFSRLRLKAERLRFARKHDHTEAVHELFRRALRVPCTRDGRAPDRARLRLMQKLPHRPLPQISRSGRMTSAAMSPPEVSPSRKRP